MNHDVRFIEFRNNRYIYEIDGLLVDLRNCSNESDINKKLKYVNNSISNRIDFRQDKLDMALREFLLFGFLFFKSELSEYFVYFIEDLIMNCEKKKLTEVLILNSIFNENMYEVQLTIHNSTDKSEEKYNNKIMEFISEQILLGKKQLIRRLLLNNDTDTISKIIKLITLNSFLQICGNDLFDEAINYFDFVIKENLLPSNTQLSLNVVIGAAVGLSRKDAKDTKNMFKSEEKNKLYKEINNLINKYDTEFYLLENEHNYLKSIERALMNHTKLNDGELATLKPGRVLKICTELFSDRFSNYLNQSFYIMSQANIKINRVNLVMEMFADIDNRKANAIYTYYKANNSNTILEDLIIKNFKDNVNKLDNPNINFKDDVWCIYWRKWESQQKVTINYTGLSNSLLKNDIKQYFMFVLNKEYSYKNEGENISRIFTKSNLIIRSLIYLQKNFNINTTGDIKLIHVHKLVKYLQNEYKTKHNKNIRVSTIASCVSSLKAFVDWLMEGNGNVITKPMDNPFSYVVFKGVYYRKTEIIPESVIDNTLLHLDELRDDIQRMLLIMLNCGLRFKEVAYLEEDCISESNDEYRILKYIPYKVLEARRRNGLDDYHRIIIDDEIFKEIESQMDCSRNLRQKYNVTEIFLTTGVNDNLSMISSSSFCAAIQRIIDKYNIVDEHGDLWKITSMQYRKTLAVDMITKGNANIHEVGNYLGHLNKNTTIEYYAEVRKKKLAEMNSDFFKKKFQLSIEEKDLERFSEEERRTLYVDFCLNKRDVEYGVCTRAYNVDNCDRRGDIFGCTTCSKICIGRKHYKRWSELYENQKNRVSSIEKRYKDIGINKDEYEAFREYEREKFLLDSFEVVVERLKGDYSDDN